ncbi:MAG: aminotransferase class V-fold PLP-dependent enzyme, partial [Planctomycetota bacterium]
MQAHIPLSRRSFLSGAAATTVAWTQLHTAGGVSAASTDAGEPDLASLPRAPTPNDEAAWEKVADQFLLRAGLVYLNTGTRGPSPKYVHQQQVKALEGINSDYFGYIEDVYNVEFRAKLRGSLASFVGADESEIALTNNTTDGMIIGTWGPTLQRGDQILYTNHDHTFGTHPILQRAKRDGLDVGVVDL